MTQEDRAWLDAHPYILGNVTTSREDLAMLYQIYNRLTGENKQPNGCGRCIMNTKKIIKYHYGK